MYILRNLQQQQLNDSNSSMKTQNTISHFPQMDEKFVQLLKKFKERLQNNYKKIQESLIDPQIHLYIVLNIQNQNIFLDQYIQSVQQEYKEHQKASVSILKDYQQNQKFVNEQINQLHLNRGKLQVSLENSDRTFFKFQQQRKVLEREITDIRHLLKQLKRKVQQYFPLILLAIKRDLWIKSIKENKQVENSKMSYLDVTFIVLFHSFSKIKTQLSKKSKKQFSIRVNQKLFNIEQYIKYLNNELSSTKIKFQSIQQKNYFKHYKQRLIQQDQIYWSNRKQLKINQIGMKKCEQIFNKIQFMIDNCNNKVWFGKKLNNQLSQLLQFLQKLYQQILKGNKFNKSNNILLELNDVIKNSKIIWAQLSTFVFVRKSKKETQINNIQKEMFGISQYINSIDGQNIDKIPLFRFQHILTKKNRIKQLKQQVDILIKQLQISNQLSISISNVYWNILELEKKNQSSNNSKQTLDQIKEKFKKIINSRDNLTLSKQKKKSQDKKKDKILNKNRGTQKILKKYDINITESKNSGRRVTIQKLKK